MVNLDVFRYLPKTTMTLGYGPKECNMLLVDAYNNYLCSKLTNKSNMF